MWHCLRGTSWLENYHSRTRTWTVQDQNLSLLLTHTTSTTTPTGNNTLSITHFHRVGEKQKPLISPKFQLLLLLSFLSPPNLYPKFFHFFFFNFLFFLLGKAKPVKYREFIILFYIYIYKKKNLKSREKVLYLFSLVVGESLSGIEIANPRKITSLTYLLARSLSLQIAAILSLGRSDSMGWFDCFECWVENVAPAIIGGENVGSSSGFRAAPPWA